MKLYLLLLILVPVALAQECCHTAQYESIEAIYLGYTLRNVPDFEPQTADGFARLIYDYTNQRQKVLYLDIDLPGNENLEYVLQIFSGDGYRTYSGYDDGSCTYEDIPDAIMAPPCWDFYYPFLIETTFSSDVPAALFGSTSSNNYLFARQSDCLPLADVATFRNSPEEGTYQWRTRAFINTTLGISDPTELDPPTDCEPVQNPSKQVPMGFLHPWTTKTKPYKNPNKKP